MFKYIQEHLPITNPSIGNDAGLEPSLNPASKERTGEGGRRERREEKRELLRSWNHMRKGKKGFLCCPLTPHVGAHPLNM